jgi:Repulsive guidance molecule (RGM) C-terminus
VLLSNPGFSNGLGLHIHIRTKVETWWSYIEQAVVQIGDQMLELRGGSNAEGGPQYWVNGIPGHANVDGDQELARMGEQLDAGFKVHYWKKGDKVHLFRIDLNHLGDAISLQTYKDWVAVNVKARKHDNFVGAKGLMGSFPSGVLLARDGVTVMMDTDAFGKEWQVSDHETMLFHEAGEVKPAMECFMPTDKTAEQRKRRLGETKVTLEDAEKVCDHVAKEDHDSCVFDVLATGDPDMAGAY